MYVQYNYPRLYPNFPLPIKEISWKQAGIYIYGKFENTFFETDFYFLSSWKQVPEKKKSIGPPYNRLFQWFVRAGWRGRFHYGFLTFAYIFRFACKNHMLNHMNYI